MNIMKKTREGCESHEQWITNKSNISLRYVHSITPLSKLIPVIQSIIQMWKLSVTSLITSERWEADEKR